MTNLPITANNPQSSASNAQGGNNQLRTDLSTTTVNDASTSRANGATNDQTAELFSTMLSRQIGEADTAALLSMQTSGTLVDKSTIADANDAKNTKDLKDVQDQATIAASTANDQANSLTTALLQIPVQQTNVHADKEKISNISMAKGANGIKQGILDNFLQRTSVNPKGADNMLSILINRQQTDSSTLNNFSSDAVKHAETIISSTSQPLSSHNISKDAPSQAPTLMSNILTSNNLADKPQTITTPIGNNGWADEFSQKIVWMNTQQNQVAELHLNPPDLGPLNVLLKISDNQLTAQFTSPHSAVRDAVENALPRLREILADSNITLGNATVSDQAPRGQQGAEGFMDQGSGIVALREASFNATNQNNLSPSNSAPVRRHNGILDIFA